MMTFLWFDLCSVGPLTCADLSYTHRSRQQPLALNAYEKYQGAIAIVMGDIITYTHIIYTILESYRKSEVKLCIHVCCLLVTVVYSEAGNKDSTHIPPSSLTHHGCDTQMDEQEARNVRMYTALTTTTNG